MATWTNARRTEWATQATQMNLTADQRDSLAAAGIVDPTDCAEIVSADDWKTVSDIARRHDDGEGTQDKDLELGHLTLLVGKAPSGGEQR